MIKLNDILSNAHFWLLAIYLAAMPLPYRYGNLILIPLILNWLVQRKYKESYEVIRDSKVFKSLVVLFLIMLASIVTSDNFAFKLSQIERYLPLIFIPIIFCGFSISSLQLKRLLLWSYVSSCVVCAVYTLISTFLVYDLSLLEVLKSREYFGYYTWVLPETLELKSNYYSLYVGFALIILADNMFERHDRSYRVLTTSTFIFLFIFFGLLSSRTSFIAVVLILIFYVLQLAFNKNRNTKRVFVVGVVLAMLISASLQFPFLKSKFTGVIVNGAEVDPRYLLFQCGWGIFSENFLWGVGILDAKELAIQCHAKLNHIKAVEDRYNFHNVFLELGAATGILGVLAFTVLMVLLFWRAIKINRLKYLGFVFLFFLACMTESILSRNKGIIFFSTFTTLLFIQKPYEENTSH